MRFEEDDLATLKCLIDGEKKGEGAVGINRKLEFPELFNKRAGWAVGVNERVKCLETYKNPYQPMPRNIFFSKPIKSKLTINRLISI